MKLSVMLFAVLAAGVSVSVSVSAGKADPKDCEVCKIVLNAVQKDLSGDDKKSLEGIETKISDYCKASGRSKSEKKVCYFLDPIKRMVSQPFKNGVPADRVCKRLKAKSAEICSVKLPVKRDFSKIDYSKLRVKELKRILAERGVTCKNCLEKSEFVKRCKETNHLEL